ncbi:hypothetical protein ACXR6G_05925 [Ancylomarina sp. YFZ004]
MKKILTIIVAMGAMVAYGQTNNSATVSQTNGNKATIVQKGGATIDATQLTNVGNGHINTIVANQFGVNNAIVNQEGKNQLVDLRQKGDGNNIMSLNQKYGHSKIITVKQVGNNNTILPFSQFGQGNTATIIQRGNDNILGKVEDHDSRSNDQSHSNNNNNNNGHSDGSILHQSGKTNTSAITQDGNGNIIKKFHQSGQENTATITQRGDENTVKKFHQSSESNTGAITQNGIANTVEKFHQSGKSNTAAITQRGDANTVKDFRQTGQSNTAAITQKGTGDNLVKEFTQKGNSNDVTVIQDGYMNEIDKIYVEGHENTMDVKQQGNSNYFGDQYSRVIGSKNTIKVNQKGDYNNVARIDINNQNDNTVKIYQDGTGNQAATGNNSSSIIDVRGTNNSLLIKQIGASNDIDQVWLFGNDNDVTFKQNGDDNKIKGDGLIDYSSHIEGNGNTVYAEQIGNGNTVTNGVDVLGSNNTVSLKQDGNGNVFQLTGSPFENNEVLVDQLGDRNVMTTVVNGASNILKLKVESSDSETTVTQNGDENKVYAFDGTKAIFQGENLTIDQQGDFNEIKMNTRRSEVTVNQNGNDYAEVDNSGTSNIIINQLADDNFVRLNGSGSGDVNFTQMNGSGNNINLTFNCNDDLAKGDVDITQDGFDNMVTGLNGNTSGMFCGTNLSIDQFGNDNKAMINSTNGSISLDQIGNSNVASITQSAN